MISATDRLLLSDIVSSLLRSFLFLAEWKQVTVETFFFGSLALASTPTTRLFNLSRLKRLALFLLVLHSGLDSFLLGIRGHAR